MHSAGRFIVGLAAGLALCLTFVPAAKAGGLVTQQAASRVGLTRAWNVQAAAPQATGPIAHLHLKDGMLLVQTTRGVVTVLDAETGRKMWSTQVGPRNHPGSEPAVNEDYVAVVTGSILYILDRHTGELQWQKHLTGTPGAGPGMSKTHVFVPMISGTIAGYKLDPEIGSRQDAWTYGSSGKISVPPVLTSHSMMWATDKGFLYVADSQIVKVRFRLETRAPIKSQPAHWTPYIYATSTDGCVYAVNEISGREEWKFAVGDPIYDAPVAIEGKVYVTSSLDGMYCLDGSNGKPLWRARSATQFVSASPSKIYAKQKSGGLIVLDAKTGASLGSLSLDEISIRLVNQQSDRVYLADNSGGVQCLHEIEAVKPVAYHPPVDIPKPAAAKPAPARVASEDGEHDEAMEGEPADDGEHGDDDEAHDEAHDEHADDEMKAEADEPTGDD